MTDNGTYPDTRLCWPCDRLDLFKKSCEYHGRRFLLDEGCALYVPLVIRQHRSGVAPFRHLPALFAWLSPARYVQSNPKGILL